MPSSSCGSFLGLYLLWRHIFMDPQTFQWDSGWGFQLDSSTRWCHSSQRKFVCVCSYASNRYLEIVCGYLDTSSQKAQGRLTECLHTWWYSRFHQTWLAEWLLTSKCQPIHVFLAGVCAWTSDFLGSSSSWSTFFVGTPIAKWSRRWRWHRLKVISYLYALCICQVASIATYTPGKAEKRTGWFAGQCCWCRVWSWSSAAVPTAGAIRESDGSTEGSHRETYSSIFGASSLPPYIPASCQLPYHCLQRCQHRGQCLSGMAQKTLMPKLFHRLFFKTIHFLG